MKKTVFTLIILQMILSLNVSGQTKKGLSLLIVIPDTASTLNSFEDFRFPYEKDVKLKLEQGVKKKNYESSKLDSLSGETINSITYYKLIAYKTADLLRFLMDPDFPQLKINLVDGSQGITGPTQFKEMAEKNASDYIVLFKEIKALMDESEVPTLTLKVVLYSRKKGAVVFQKDVVGGIANEGGRSICSGMFDCMVNNSVSAASNIIYEHLSRIKDSRSK